MFHTYHDTSANRRGGLRESVGAGLGTKFRYSPLTEQQNPPSPPITEQQNPPLSPITEQQNPPLSPITEQQNPPYLTDNGTTKPALTKVKTMPD
ncbi:hypothetical protein [Coleofasciculus sp.]|uniref:hypothetical protein n=1 Tax=Coleofasciculus sp. TaxID=3100458 RepID=UPI003A2FE463